jgi:hypothetical protein
MSSSIVACSRGFLLKHPHRPAVCLMELEKDIKTLVPRFGVSLQLGRSQPRHKEC